MEVATLSFNGSGTFALPSGNPVVTNTVISSTWANTTLSQIATGLSTAICKDGQQTLTANIPFSGYKPTGVGLATSNTDLATYLQILAVGGAKVINGIIGLSVSASALTISLKTIAVADPSATAPVYVTVPTVAAGVFDGGWAMRSAVAALSTTISSGSTAGQVSTVASDIFFYLIDNAGTLELAWSGKFFGGVSIQSSTAEGGAGAADSATVLYSTTARSNVACVCLGKWTSTQVTAGTWAATTGARELYPFNDIFSGREVLLSSQTASASSSIDFSAPLVGAMYDEYRLEIVDAAPGTNAANMLLRVSQAGVFDSGGTSYAYSGASSNDGGAISGIGSASTSSIAIAANCSTESTRAVCGEVRFWKPSGTTHRKNFSFEISYNADGVGITWSTGSGAFQNGVGAIDGVRIIMSSGTIASGTFNLYGIRK